MIYKDNLPNAKIGRIKRCFSIFSLLIILVLLSGLSNSAKQAASQTSDASSTAYVDSDNELLVKFNPNISPARKKQIHRQNGGQQIGSISELGVQVVRIPGNSRIWSRLYERNSQVEYAEPNGVYQATISANDPQVSEQWQYNNTGQTGGRVDADIDSFEAWDVTFGSSSVQVAVLDSGIEAIHPDLQGKVKKSVNFTDSDTLNDILGHGTHVSGSIAALSDNGIGVAGTCGNCTLQNVKVLNDTGSGSWSWIASGIRWATDNDARVINMSLGGARKSRTVEDAVNYAWSKGVVVVAAAGNRSTNRPEYPAYYKNVIAVGATDHNDSKASFSNYGSKSQPWVDLAAPGVRILSTTVNKGYGFKSGTSMATPHVSGVAGLIWSTDFCRNTDIANNASCVRDRLEAEADRVPGTSTWWAKGRVNANSSIRP